VRLFLAIASGGFCLTTGVIRGQVAPEPINDIVVAQLKEMPSGGKYSASTTATNRLRSAAQLQAGKFLIEPERAMPSYCSGATYLVFLKTIEVLRGRGLLRLDDATLAQLRIRGQRDGEGIWGRWNANGPGTARLFFELGLGPNFDDFARAQAGDFMKIFWTQEVGRAEHGHSVVFLGTETHDGVDYVRFWSSNIPLGYGEKIVPRSRIAHAIFSRLETPAHLEKIADVPRLDPYLSSLERVRSSYAEARAMCGM
jgi:hypothetical protein